MNRKGERSMKYSELLPTKENIINTIEEDILGRNKDIMHFYQLLATQNSSGIIAIDGKWGSGKTFFVKQLEYVIDAYNPASVMDDDTRKRIISKIKIPERIDNCCKAVYYDSWANDNSTDPIISLVYEITRQTSTQYDISICNLSGTAASIIEAFSGRSIKGILDNLRAENPIEKIKQETNLEDNIKFFFQEAVNEKGNRMIIFIDELDRCKPTFAVGMLERIKHYLCDDRITFVISTNIVELQHTIKHYYGESFDACRYLDRFFGSVVALPSANLDKYYIKIGMRESVLSSICERIVEMYHFEPREIARFTEQINTSMYRFLKCNEYDDLPSVRGKRFVLVYIIPLIIALRKVSIDLYNEFINGENSEQLYLLLTYKGTDLCSFHEMINKNETLSNEEGKATISKKDVSDRFYKEIFVDKYNCVEYSKQYGNYEFDKESKGFAIRVANLMSDYASFLN